MKFGWVRVRNGKIGLDRQRFRGTGHVGKHNMAGTFIGNEGSRSLVLGSFDSLAFLRRGKRRCPKRLGIHARRPRSAANLHGQKKQRPDSELEALGFFRVSSCRTFAIDGSHQDMEVGRMPYKWPADTDFALWELDVIDRACPACGRMMYICDHRYRRLHTLDGPVQLVCKLNHCPDRLCPGHARTKSPELEVTIAPPSWAIGWDVFCWIGHRRCSRHMSIPHIQSELQDDYAIKLSDDAIAKYIQRYQVMLAARQQDPEVLRRQYESVDEIVLSIDGLQPEKGHETLYVVRELTQKRVWFAEALISATADEVQRSDRPGQGVGQVLEQDGQPLDLGQAGRVRDGDRGGVS